MRSYGLRDGVAFLIVQRAKSFDVAQLRKFPTVIEEVRAKDLELKQDLTY